MVSAKDIAKRLGVSPATVSLVLNNKSGVGEDTRRRILETAQKMGYSKKHIPHSVQNGVITLAIFKKAENVIANSFPEFVTEGISLRAQQLGYTVQITYLSREDLLSQPVTSLFPNTSGVILFATEANRSDLTLLSELKLPIILVDNTYETLHLDNVMIGNHQGAYCATKYLMDNGHTDIGFIGGDADLSSFTERQDGFIRAVSSDPRSIKSAENIFILPMDVNLIYPTFKELLLGRDSIPTAFVLRHDLIANICYQVLYDLGYSIPDDVSIVGFDNNPICELITPKLTTIAVPMQRIGVLAVNRLHEIIQNSPEENIRIDVIPHLLVRDSVKRLV